MKPIGYWLNRTDRAITQHMFGVLEEYGLTRIAWQVLNVVADAPQVPDTEVLSVLEANADVATLTAAIETVLADGWADRSGPDQLALTPDGRQRLAKVAERVAAFRELSMSGISMDEYRNAVGVLERMTHNLEAGRTERGQRSSPTPPR